MPIYDFKCDKCGYTNEYLVGANFANGGNAPEKCPKCNDGKMEKYISRIDNFQFDIIGWSPDNEYGKKNWKRRLSPEDQVKVLTPDHNGKYKDPW